MLSLRPLDERVPIQQQLGAEASPAILINVFTVAPEDVDGLLAAWEHDANWMKKQPGISRRNCIAASPVAACF